MIKSVKDKIFIIENYINRDTCDFLVECFKDNIQETPRKGIFGGPTYGKGTQDSGKSDGQNFFTYGSKQEFNIGIDLLAGLVERTSKTISDYYDSNYYVKSMFWSKMTEGAKNTLHMDNWYENFDHELRPRPFNINDRSGLLYLSDNYDGGEIYFPRLDFKIKPSAGTFIFFEGDIDTVHEVLEVKSGTRCNLISFYGNNGTLDTNNLQEQYLIQEVQSTADSLNNIKEIIKDYDRFE